MPKLDKKIEQMRSNPKGDWTIADLKGIANRLGIAHRQAGTSHVTFRAESGEKLTVPTHKQIKVIYVNNLIELIDNLGESR